MKANDLLALIGEVKEEQILEAKTAAKRRLPRWVNGTAAAAACLAVVLCGAMLLPKPDREEPDMTPGSGGSSSGHGEGTVFMSYAGPIFPLSVLEGGADLEAQRRLTYDFSLYGAEREEMEVWDSRENGMVFTDFYTLYNSTGEDFHGTAVYPVIGNFQTVNWPEITVNRAPIDWQIHTGGYSGGFYGAGDGHTTSMNLKSITSWEGYEALLWDGSYLQEAFEEVPALTTPVVVYTLSNFTGGSQSDAATLSMGFTVDPEQTQILTYGFNGGGENAETGEVYRDFFLSEGGMIERENRKYLIVAGNDLSGYTLQGYRDGGCTPGDEIDLGADVSRQEMTLGEALWQIARRFFEAGSKENLPYFNEKIDFEMYFQEVCRYFAAYSPMGTEPKERYHFGRLDDIMWESVHHDRIFYLTFDIVVPAGEAVEVSARGVKHASFDFDCAGSENAGIDGYDMVTTLGSSLSFTSQKACVEHDDGIEIVRQNYGFDLAGGITEVTLDPNQPHYWMEIVRRASE